MTNGFQKSANNTQELLLTHPGIINPDDFTAHFDLHCYQPSPDLQPFVVHIWTQRYKQPAEPLYKPPVEILSGPNTYLFFTPSSTFIHRSNDSVFSYDPCTSDTIAGVKFQPGGFYTFLQRPLSELTTTTPAAASVFPQADKAFTERLLGQSDATIVSAIEKLLRSKHPHADKNLTLVNKIVNRLDADPSLRTVSATAQNFGISERSLQLLFQTYVGIGIKRIITRKRLLEAINQAQSQPQRTWADIAMELDYSSQSHFSREFKEITGLTPSEYTKSL